MLLLASLGTGTGALSDVGALVSHGYAQQAWCRPSFSVLLLIVRYLPRLFFFTTFRSTIMGMEFYQALGKKIYLNYGTSVMF